MTPARFPHSDTPGSTLGCQLPRAYRRLLRPSSALDAKASTTCPSQLVTHTTNPTPEQPATNNRQPATGNETDDAHTTHTHMTRHKETHTTNTHPRPIKPTMRTQQTNTTTTPTPTHPYPYLYLYVQAGRQTGRQVRSSDARVHYPDLKQQPH